MGQAGYFALPIMHTETAPKIHNDQGPEKSF